MSNLNQRIAALSSEQRELLARQMAQVRKSSAPHLYIQPVPRESNVIPLSFVQRRIWFMEQFAPGSPAYNMSGAARVIGPVNLDTLEQCFSEVIRRHETLRTTFTIVDGQPAGVIAPVQPVALRIIDLRGESRAEREEKAHQLGTREVRRPFDLEHGPLFRLTVVQLADEEILVMMTMHHIISDGWSTKVFFQETGMLYWAFLAGEPSPLPELAFQYADFAQWQQQWLQGDILDSLLVYWKQRLSGDLPLLALPTDHPRPAMQTFRGARQPLALSPTLTHRLKELSRGQGSTLFMTLLAAFKTLLHRYTGQDDILVGIPIANRTHAGTEALLGAFVNTLVLRADLSGNPSFLKLLEQVQGISLDAYTYQDLPFEKLVEELHPERDLSHTPLFQVLFNFQSDPTEATQIPGLTLEDIPAGTAKFELTLNLVMNKGCVAGHIEYNTDLFDPATIRRLAGHYQTLLEGIAADPTQRLSDLPLLTETEQQQVLVEWNATQFDYARDLCVHQLFEMQAAQTPEAVAILFEDQQLTYQEVNRRANQLAHHLRSLGVEPETLVGICVQRSPEMIIGMLGILKSGGAYVPLDSTYPRDRLSFMIRDAGLSVIVTQERLEPGLRDEKVQLVCLDHSDDFNNDASEENPCIELLPESLAYVLYTSGSTGRPKGVMVRHGNLANLLRGVDRCIGGVAATDVMLAVTSISFDISIVELLWTLTRGIHVVILAEAAIISTQSNAEYSLLAQALKYRPTLMQCTPSLMRMLTLQPEAMDALRSVRALLLAGEALPVVLAKQLKSMLPGRLMNMYGPTETTIWSTAYEVTDVGDTVPIGSPLINTRLYILDHHLQIVPPGITGELYIGGDGVARGYLNRPDITAERFIQDPFSRMPGTRLYKTGDLARYLPNGTVEYLGRADYQVKIGGHRIELEEIEAILDQHPFVREAIVLVRGNALDDKRLVAYIVLDAASSSSGLDQVAIMRDLKSFLKEKLPDYMLPSNFVQLDAFPLTLNGKIDRKALPALQAVWSASDFTENFAEPSNELEQALAEIWEQVLGIEHLGIHDSFFDLGGHSLLATQLIFRLRDVLQVEIPLYFLFQTPTVAGMARSIVLFREKGPAAITDAGAFLDLAAEAVLDPAIQPHDALSMNSVTEPQQVFLTGATGFLGAFLLDELLHQTDAQVHCLVRASTVEGGRDRIRQNLASYGLGNEAFTSRIIPVMGDLARPLLGLSAEEFHRMAGLIDVIYHNGALVSFLYPYAALKAANVLGTQEVLRLASSVTVKPVHYVSTFYVFSRSEYAAGTVLREQDNPRHGLTYTLGYTQSKWVAEQLVMEAGSRGLPVSIYRPGRISGHSQTGVSQLNDFVWQSLQVGIRVGAAPDIDMSLDMAPVDYVSKAIIHLSRQEASRGKNFHLVNPYPIHTSALIDWMEVFGYTVNVVPYEAWCALVRERAERFPDSTARGLTPLLSGALPIDQLPKVEFDNQNTRDGLAGASIACPPVDTTLLTTYFSDCIRSGYFDAPPLVESRKSA